MKYLDRAPIRVRNTIFLFISIIVIGLGFDVAFFFSFVEEIWVFMYDGEGF